MAKAKAADDLNNLDELDNAIAFAGGDLEEDDDEEVVADRGDNPDGEPEPEPEAPAEKVEEEEAPAEEQEAPAEKLEEKEEPAEEADARIPKKRFDQVNERMKAAERRLRELEQQEKAVGEAEEGKYDFDAAEAAAAELLLDGRMEDYQAKRREIRMAQEAEWDAKAAATSTVTFSQQRENEAIQEIANTASSTYPQFDNESEEFDEGLLDEVVAQMDSYVRLGHDRVTAFDKAVKNVVKVYDLGVPAAEEPAQAAKPTTAAKPTRSAAEKQPPASTGAHGDAGDSTGASAFDPTRLSEEEFDALPLSKLRELRGDDF